MPWQPTALNSPDGVWPSNILGHIFAQVPRCISQMLTVHLDDPETGVSILSDHAADVVALGKAALGDLDWPARVRNGRPLDELGAGRAGPTLMGEGRRRTPGRLPEVHSYCWSSVWN